MEGLGGFVAGLDVAAHGVFEIGDGFEDAAVIFLRVIVEKVVRQPIQNIGMFVRSVIVGDGVNDLAGWSGALHGGLDTSGRTHYDRLRGRPSTRARARAEKGAPGAVAYRIGPILDQSYLCLYR